jgi:hypothetical protein
MNECYDKSFNRIQEMTNIQDEARELFKRKNADYGDSFSTYGPVGVIVRMGDKIQRLVSLTTKGVALVDNESLRDTLIDLHNYSTMAIMLIDEQNSKKTQQLMQKRNDDYDFNVNISYY